MATLHGWQVGWALTTATFAYVEWEVGRRLLFDVWMVHAGFDDLCNLMAPSGRRLQSVSLDGHTVLFLPSSLHEMQVQLAYYRLCKR